MKKLLTIMVISIILFINMGCIMDNNDINVNYEIHIKNESGNEYKILLPAIILGNQKYNTPVIGNITPIVSINDFEIVEGDAKINYLSTSNSTLMSITSKSNELKVVLKKSMSSDKYYKYKGQEYGTLHPYLNSYYNSLANNRSVGLNYMYDEKILNVSFSFGMEADHQGRWEYIESNFELKDPGFQLVNVKIDSEVT